MRKATLINLAIALSIPVLISGCGGGNSSSGADGDITTTLTGSWVGTWENDELGPGSENQGFSNEGFMRADLQQDSQGNISGTATWTGFACFLNTNVTGIVSQRAVSLTFVSDAARVTFNGRRNNNMNMTGDWTNDVGCIGEGDLVLNREL